MLRRPTWLGCRLSDSGDQATSDRRPVSLQFDGEGIVMVPTALRATIAKAATRARRKLSTRLSPGEKNNPNGWPS